MKKLILTTMLSIPFLGACTTVIKADPVENSSQIKHICIKDRHTEIKDFSTYLANSLQKKSITSEVKENPSSSCKYILAYSLAERNGYVLVAKLKLHEVNSKGKTVIGSLVYKRRGEEKEKVKVTGVQGQTDYMINELLK